MLEAIKLTLQSSEVPFKVALMGSSSVPMDESGDEEKAKTAGFELRLTKPVTKAGIAKLFAQMRESYPA